MTPLERSRFATESANDEALPMGGAGFVGISSASVNIQSHHGWTSGIGDCCTDRKTSCAVLICEPTVMGQLVQRIWRRKYTCIIVSGLLWIGAIGNLISTWYVPPCEKVYDTDQDGRVSNAEANPDANGDGLVTAREYLDKVEPYYDCQDDFYSSGRFIIASILGGLFMALMCLFTMLVRRHVRGRDSIPVTICAGFDDCLCAMFCLCCVQCQLLRHEGL